MIILYFNMSKGKATWTSSIYFRVSPELSWSWQWWSERYIFYGRFRRYSCPALWILWAFWPPQDLQLLTKDERRYSIGSPKVKSTCQWFIFSTLLSFFFWPKNLRFLLPFRLIDKFTKKSCGFHLPFPDVENLCSLNSLTQWEKVRTSHF